MGNRCVWLGGELEDVEWSIVVHRLDRQKNWTDKKRLDNTEHNKQSM